MVLLLLGYLLMADARFDTALQKGWRGALVGALALTVLMFPIWDFSAEPSPLRFVLQWTVRGVGAWFWLVAMLGAYVRVRTYAFASATRTASCATRASSCCRSTSCTRR